MTCVPCILIDTRMDCNKKIIQQSKAIKNVKNNAKNNAKIIQNFFTNFFVFHILFPSKVLELV